MIEQRKKKEKKTNMDDFKDVMLSELPSHAQRAPAYTSNISSLENYKGILLCDRPTDARMSMGAQQAPFLPPGRLDDRSLGMQPSIEKRMTHDLAKNMRAERTKNVPPTALNRHKQFLRKLNEQVRTTQVAAVEKLANKDDQRKKFQHAQENYRNMLREAAIAQSQDPTRCEQPEAPAVEAPAKPPTPPAVAKTSAPAKERKKAEKEKPTWAMTAEEADEHEMSEAAKLVAFAQGLDFDAFINDFEVREALSIMQERVRELQEGGAERPALHLPKVRTDNDDAVSVTASEKERRVQSHDFGNRDLGHDKEWDGSTKQVNEVVRTLLSADSLVLADRILGKSDHLRQIYSKQALARMLQDALTSNMSADPLKPGIPPLNKKATLGPLPTHPSDALGPNTALHSKPVIASVSAEAQFGQKYEQKRILVDLKKSKDNVQNLPYLYRCPSI